MKATPPNRSYYPALDGLRGIAILLVICSHNFNFFPHFSRGWVGVDLFFVLSGFLITDILLRTKQSDNFLRNFYVRRALRIFPLYYGALILFFLVAPAIGSIQDQYKYYSDHSAMSFFHLQNWLYILNEKPVDHMLFGHFWSLSVEEQYYFAWPLVILLVRSKKAVARVAIVLLTACIILRFASWIYLGPGYTNFQFQFMTRMDGLCIGSLLAIWRQMDELLSWKKFSRFCFACLGMHAIVWIAILTIPRLEFPHFSIFGYTSISAVFGLAVGGALHYRNKLTRILELRSLKFMGKISYGLYIFHWPVLVFFKLYLLDEFVSSGISNFSSILIISVLALLTALIISLLSYRFVESKFLSMKDKLTSDEWLSKTRRKIHTLLRPS